MVTKSLGKPKLAEALDALLEVCKSLAHSSDAELAREFVASAKWLPGMDSNHD